MLIIEKAQTIRIDVGKTTAQIVGHLHAAGGQRLSAIPSLDLVDAMNCGNYGKSGWSRTRLEALPVVTVSSAAAGRVFTFH